MTIFIHENQRQMFLEHVKPGLKNKMNGLKTGFMKKPMRKKSTRKIYNFHCKQSKIFKKLCLECKKNSVMPGFTRHEFCS